MTTRVLDRSAVYASVVIAGILFLLPFHAFLTTWIGSNTGHLDAVRIWKELLIYGLIPVALVIVWRGVNLQAWLRTSWLPRLIILYLLLNIILGLFALRGGQVTPPALIYGLLANLRFMGFFLITYVVSSRSDFLRRYWKALILIPAVLVIAFGLMQHFLLPYDFLRHFGYGPHTIPAYQTVDQKLHYQRIQSTLRGANPLGAYIVLITPLILIIKQPKFKYGLIGAGTIAIGFTYSRSAWIGALLAGLTYGYLSITKRKARQLLLVLMATLVIFMSLGIVLLRHNSTIQNVFFHTDNASNAISSNTGRAKALEDGLHGVAKEPWGRGPGTAGPASTRNYSVRISENYYIQIGQEVGWTGLILFLAIMVNVGYQLWRRKADEFNRALLAALIGISFINLLSHAWADDTLSLLWWGLAGIALTPVILKHKYDSPKKGPKTRS